MRPLFFVIIGVGRCSLQLGWADVKPLVRSLQSLVVQLCVSYMILSAVDKRSSIYESNR